MGKRGPKATPLFERMWNDVDTSGECWVYTKGSKVKGGYRQTNDMGRSRLAHRVVYETIHGELPPRVEVMHLCDNPPCVHPCHLQAGTRTENEHMKNPNRLNWDRRRTLPSRPR